MIHIVPIEQAQLDQHYEISLDCLVVRHEVWFFLSNTKGKFESRIGVQPIRIIKKLSLQ